MAISIGASASASVLPMNIPAIPLYKIFKFSVCPSSFSGHHLNAPRLLITSELTAGWNKEMQFVVRLIWCWGSSRGDQEEAVIIGMMTDESRLKGKALKMSIGQTLQRNQREIGDGLFAREEKGE